MIQLRTLSWPNLAKDVIAQHSRPSRFSEDIEHPPDHPWNYPTKSLTCENGQAEAGADAVHKTSREQLAAEACQAAAEQELVEVDVWKVMQTLTTKEKDDEEEFDEEAEAKCLQAEVDKVRRALRGWEAEVNDASLRARRHADEEPLRREAQYRRDQLADCCVCFETREKAQMCQLQCEHYYCRECIQETASANLKARTELSCCHQPASAATLQAWLPPATAVAYALLLEERATPRPLYCARAGCGAWIRPADVRGGVGECRMAGVAAATAVAAAPATPAIAATAGGEAGTGKAGSDDDDDAETGEARCGARTCAACRALEHEGVCEADRDGRRVMRLAARYHWRACPSCRAIVERTDGCPFMACRCGGEFCYSCGQAWAVCQSGCNQTWAG